MTQQFNPSSKVTILSLILLIISFGSCTKDDKKDEPTDPGGVYAVYSYGNQHRNRKAFLWKDGVETDLTSYVNLPRSTTSSKLYLGGVAVAPTGDVYVSGCECRGGLDINNYLNEDCYTVLWKNGQKQNLNATGGSFWYIQSEDNILRINKSGDVFVMGKSGDYVTRTIWKNGSPIYNFENIRELYDMYVQGNDVYVMGADTLPTYPKKLWKNGVGQNIPSTGTYPRSLLVTNSGDVYIGMGNGKLLKNNSEQSLAVAPGSSKGEIEDIFEAGGDIYVLGTVYNANVNKTVVWKNGIQLYELNLSNPAYLLDNGSVFVAGGDVYVYASLSYNTSPAGIGNQNVVIWKNGQVFKVINARENAGGPVYAPSFFIK